MRACVCVWCSRVKQPATRQASSAQPLQTQPPSPTEKTERKESLLHTSPCFWKHHTAPVEAGAGAVAGASGVECCRQMGKVEHARC